MTNKRIKRTIEAVEAILLSVALAFVLLWLCALVAMSAEFGGKQPREIVRGEIVPNGKMNFMVYVHGFWWPALGL